VPKRADYAAGEKGDSAYEMHLDRKGERVYRDLLADKPVGEVLGRLQQLVSALTD
jgi:hypothetical protein